MRHPLTCHPDSRCDAAIDVSVVIARPDPGALHLRYGLAGAIDEIALPAAARPARADELWQHTCFEAFLRAPRGGSYYEFNFAPSLQWAAYQFDGYRSGMRSATEMNAPLLDVRIEPDIYELDVQVDLAQTRDLQGETTWRLGVAAVIETTAGQKSYWALAHPPGKPDFHHEDGFVHQLAVTM